jgi:transposase
MITAKLFEQALGLIDPWYIKDIDFNLKEKQLNIYVDFKKGSSFEYNKNKISGSFKVYDTVKKTYRHLNFFQHECFLHARIPRIDTGNNKPKMINPPWEGKEKGFTLLFEALLIELCSAMPIHKVAQMINVSDNKLWNMLEKYINEIIGNMDLSEIKTIGLDETSKKKGHDYITLFVDLIKKRTIFITEGKSSDTVKAFKAHLENHNGKADNIKNVSSDMSPAFIKGIREALPEAEITFDKFHILKIINKAVDEVRRQEVVNEQVLKGTRYIFLKNRWNRTKKQSEKINELTLSRLNLKTIRAYHIRERFQEIYNTPDEIVFEELLNKWYYWATHSRLKPMIKAARTIKNHWEGILNWRKSKINNGILEGLNSVIQAVKSRARGYKTFKNFKIMAYIVTGKFDYSSINKFIKLPTQI